MKNIPAKFALLILSFAVLGTIEIRAQENSCALKLELLNFSSGGEVKNAAATATNIKTRRVYRSVLKDGLPYFAGLPEGEYDIIVAKAGFKRSKDGYEVACEDATEGCPGAARP